MAFIEKSNIPAGMWTKECFCTTSETHTSPATVKVSVQ